MLISALLHFFWMSVVTVVVTPSDIERAKFSEVFFLGPLLEKAHLELRVQLKNPTPLERKYLDDVIRMVDIEYLPRKKSSVPSFFISSDETFVRAIKEIFCDQKIRLEYFY